MLKFEIGSSFTVQIAGPGAETLSLGPFAVRYPLNVDSALESFVRFLHMSSEFEVRKTVEGQFDAASVNLVDLNSASFVAWLLERGVIFPLSITNPLTLKNVAFSAERKSDGKIDVAATIGEETSSYQLDPIEDYVDVIWHFASMDRLMQTPINVKLIENRDPFDDPLPVRIAAALIRERAEHLKPELNDMPLPYDNGLSPNGDRVAQNKARDYRIVIREPEEFAGEYGVSVSFSEIHRASTRRNPEGSKSSGFGVRAQRIKPLTDDEKLSETRLLARTVRPADVHNLFMVPQDRERIPAEVCVALAQHGGSVVAVMSPHGDIGVLALCEVEAFAEEHGYDVILTGQRPVFRLSRWQDRDVSLLSAFIDAREISALDDVLGELQDIAARPSRAHT